MLPLRLAMLLFFTAAQIAKATTTAIPAKMPVAFGAKTENAEERETPLDASSSNLVNAINSATSLALAKIATPFQVAIGVMMSQDVWTLTLPFAMLTLTAKELPHAVSTEELLLVACSWVLVSLPLLLEVSCSTDGGWERRPLILNSSK